MKNHFKTALNDPEIVKLYKDKPFHMATLHALSVYTEKGYSLADLPWFKLTKQAHQIGVNKRAA